MFLACGGSVMHALLYMMQEVNAMPHVWNSELWKPVRMSKPQSESGKELSSPERSFYDIQPSSERYEVPGIFPTKKPLNFGIWSKR